MKEMLQENCRKIFAAEILHSKCKKMCNQATEKVPQVQYLWHEILKISIASADFPAFSLQKFLDSRVTKSLKHELAISREDFRPSRTCWNDNTLYGKWVKSFLEKKCRFFSIPFPKKITIAADRKIVRQSLKCQWHYTHTHIKPAPPKKTN